MTTLTNLSSEELASLSEQTSAQLDTLRERYAEIENQISPVYELHRQLLDEVDRRKIASMENAPDWPFLLEETGDSPSIRHRACEKAIRALAPELDVSGYNYELQQRVVRIAISKREPLDRCLAGIETLLPFIKERTDESSGVAGNIKYLSITSDDLSESGILSLVVNEVKNFYEVRKNRFGRSRPLKTFNSLRDALMYVQREHSYH